MEPASRGPGRRDDLLDVCHAPSPSLCAPQTRNGRATREIALMTPAPQRFPPDWPLSPVPAWPELLPRLFTLRKPRWFRFSIRLSSVETNTTLRRKYSAESQQLLTSGLLIRFPLLGHSRTIPASRRLP